MNHNNWCDKRTSKNCLTEFSNKVNGKNGGNGGKGGAAGKPGLCFTCLFTNHNDFCLVDCATCVYSCRTEKGKVRWH